MGSDVEGDYGESDPDWDVLEQGAEDSGDDAESLNSQSRNLIRFLHCKQY